MKTWAGDGADRALRDGILWNFGSLGVLAAAGLVLQVVIGAAFGASALGVFNQVFAWYISVSQLAVMGAHFSVLRHLSDAEPGSSERGSIATAGLLMALVLSALIGALFFLAAGPIGALADSPAVALGIKLAAPGILFFALNKVVLAVLNGQKRMRAFAVYQALRPVLLLTGAVGLAVTDGPAEYLAATLSVTEGILFLLMLPSILKLLFTASVRGLGRWLSHHWRFGSRSAPSGILSEVNTRVDVLILGVVASDAIVGLYSFAAMLAEGVAQTLIVVRNNINPYLTRAFRADTAPTDLAAFVAEWKRNSLLVAIAASVLGLAGFPVLVWIMGDPQFMAAYVYFAIILAGVVLGSRFLAFAQTLMLAGRPGWHTVMSLTVVALNGLLNAALAPWLLALGSALATGLAFALSWLILRGFSRRVLEFSL